MRKVILAAVAAASMIGAAGAASAQTVVVERYGRWDPAWGVAPPPPPRVAYWRHRENRWYEHVHACRVRSATYDPRRDMIRIHNRWVPCRD